MSFTMLAPMYDTVRKTCTVCGKRRKCHKCVSCDERMCTDCSIETKEFYIEEGDDKAQFKVFVRCCVPCRDEALDFDRGWGY